MTAVACPVYLGCCSINPDYLGCCSINPGYLGCCSINPGCLGFCSPYLWYLGCCSPYLWYLGCSPHNSHAALPPKAKTAGRKSTPSLPGLSLEDFPPRAERPVRRLLEGFVAWPLLLESSNWVVYRRISSEDTFRNLVVCTFA